MLISQGRALLLGVACAASLLLGGCDSTSAPTPPPLADEPAAARAASHDVVVTGTGTAAIDVPAVQGAVDQGGRVVLKGHFSFQQPPTIANPLAGYPPATVLVSKAVTITGTGKGGRERDEHDADETTTIEGGSIPFFVNAPGARVTVERLRFVQPVSDAVLVFAASGLTIASNRVDGVQPFQQFGAGIEINTSGVDLPTPASPGKPENVSGSIQIVDNDIDAAGGSSGDNTLGITVFSVGVDGAEVEAHVSGNAIRNVTEPAINFRRIVGHAYIEGNRIVTGAVAGSAPRDQVIRVVNIGTYRIAHNSVDCQWANAEAEGIGVFSQIASWPVESATVVDNTVNMSSPPGTVFTDFSAAIALYGFAAANVVRHNSIRGRARAGLSIPVFPLPPKAPAAPQDNAFIRNHFGDFVPSLADIFVGGHALRTRIEGRGTVVDLGDGTIIER